MRLQALGGADNSHYQYCFLFLIPIFCLFYSILLRRLILFGCVLYIGVLLIELELQMQVLINMTFNHLLFFHTILKRLGT